MLTIIGLIIMVILFLSALFSGNAFTIFIKALAGIIGLCLFGVPGLFMGVIICAFIFACITKLITQPKEFLSDLKECSTEMYERAKNETKKQKQQKK